MEQTRITLLSRMRKPGSDPAWQEFFDRYAPVLLNYATRICGDPHMAEDVLQETMMALLRELPDFHYDPARGLFRNYLLTITHKRCIGALRRAGREARLIELRHPWQLEQMVDEAAGSADVNLVAAWRQTMEDEAWRCVREKSGYEARSLKMYEEHVRKGRPALEVAQEFGATVNQVYQVKIQVGRRLRAELQKLLEGLGEAAQS